MEALKRGMMAMKEETKGEMEALKRGMMAMKEETKGEMEALMAMKIEVLKREMMA